MIFCGQLADSLEFESDKHLTSNIEKLRRERLMLAHWAKKLNDSGTAGIKKVLPKKHVHDSCRS